MVITTRPLGVGVMVKPADVKIAKVPADAFPKGAFSKVEDVLDRPRRSCCEKKCGSLTNGTATWGWAPSMRDMVVVPQRGAPTMNASDLKSPMRDMLNLKLLDAPFGACG